MVIRILEDILEGMKEEHIILYPDDVKMDLFILHTLELYHIYFQDVAQQANGDYFNLQDTNVHLYQNNHARHISSRMKYKI